MERKLSVEMVLPPVLAVQITRYQLLVQHQKMTANMVNWEQSSKIDDVTFEFQFAMIKIVGWCSGTAANFPRRRLSVPTQSEAGSLGHQAVIGRGSH